MKKGVLNYSITWTEDGMQHEELHFTKRDTIKRYIDILDAELVARIIRDDRIKSRKTSGISSLRVWEIYANPEKPAQDITSRINRFLEN